MDRFLCAISSLSLQEEGNHCQFFDDVSRFTLNIIAPSILENLAITSFQMFAVCTGAILVWKIL